MAEATIQKESRVKKTLLNAKVNLIFYFLTLALSFFSRKIFLDCLGADFVGLTGTLQNLLGFLNLAELGIGSAIGYLLYKPLYEKDQTKITEIISVMGYLYRWIGFIILGGGIILSAFLPLIFPDSSTGFQLPLIYFAYYAFLTSTLIGYFINYRQNLLGADQRNYVVTAYFQSMNIAKTIIQMALAYYTGSYYLWIATELIFGIIYSFILNWKINQTYPWLKAEFSLGKNIFKKYPEVMKYTKQIFIHKIGGFFQFQATPLLVYTFSSLSIVALYQNYTLITLKVATAFSNVFGGIGASIGNLIAEGNQKKIIATFRELMAIRFFIAGIICVPIYLLIDPFIVVWIGKDYLLNQTTLIILMISTFINSTRSIIDDFNNGYGLFWDIWSPIIESIILVTVGVVGGIYFGFNGVLMGPLTGLILVISLWKPYLLFHWGFKISIIKYWLLYIKYILCILGPTVATIYISKVITIDPFINFYNWVLFSMVITIFYAVLSYVTFVLTTNGMRDFNKRFFNLLRTKFLKTVYGNS